MGLSRDVESHDKVSVVTMTIFCLENCQKYPNFNVSDKMPTVIVKRTPNFCSPFKN